MLRDLGKIIATSWSDLEMILGCEDHLKIVVGTNLVSIFQLT